MKRLLIVSGLALLLILLLACSSVVRVVGPNCVTTRHTDPVTLVEVDSLICVTP
jgi:hypothetical protein